MLAWIIWPSVLRRTVPFMPIKQCSFTTAKPNNLGKTTMFVIKTTISNDEMKLQPTGVQQQNINFNQPLNVGIKYVNHAAILELQYFYLSSPNIYLHTYEIPTVETQSQSRKTKYKNRDLAVEAINSRISKP